MMTRMIGSAVCLSLCAALLAGCGGMSPRTLPDGSVAFPDRGSASLKEGTFVNVDNLRQVVPGLTKAQVYALIREPHFDEGLFNVHVWNYIFDFHTGHGEDFVTCQYQIQFDDHALVKAVYWKNPACAAWLEKPAHVEAPATPAPPQQFSLNSDVLFPFGKSALADLLPAGRAALDKLVQAIGERYSTIQTVTITGYSDRIGLDADNQRLSQARAESVGRYLARNGVAADAISTTGKGSTNPVATNCPDGRSARAIRCLAPDRRVTIDVSGARN